jgi:hypothetical protein
MPSTNCSALLSALLTLCISGATQAQQLSAFYQHQTHCTSLRGGVDYVGESLSAQFARDWSAELKIHTDKGASVAEAVKKVGTLCEQTQAGRVAK